MSTNFVEYIKNLGVSFEENFLTEESVKNFILSRELNSSQNYFYFMKYSKIPSSVSTFCPEENLDDLIKFLGEKGFKAIYVNSQINRYVTHKVYLSHQEYKIIIDLEKEEKSKIDDDGDMSDSNNISLDLCFDPSVNDSFVYEIREKFGIKDFNKQKGKILLFEKNEYNDVLLTPHNVKGFDLDISENYNTDFEEVDKKVKHWITDFSANNNKLVLFHGVPGSGKTNYIKHLLTQDNDVKKIYIPPYFVQSMADPSFLPIIRREKQSVLIIEDAEKILSKREDVVDNSIISILLNLCDGIMADVLDFKIIATFNIDENQIDDALKRRGRMFLKYKFDKLSKEKTSNLYKKIHQIEPPKDEMTLAEIYNAENNFGKKPEERKMGFMV
jgi:hypothetical protein